MAAEPIEVQVMPRAGDAAEAAAAAAKPAPEPDLEAQAEPSVRHSKLELAERVNFSFEDVKYTVQPPKGAPPKTILHGISGYVEGGELVGIMGPSGSGKTTLLDFLANRLSTGQREGTVRVNGLPRRERLFRHQSAYVPQSDESLMGSLTVREVLSFSGELSLAEGTPAAEKRERVEQIMAELGLDNVADVPVGSVFRKGISGGQKRRLSMGAELLELPKILFLDEPTSGLDSSSAYRTIESCRKIARTGRVVMCTIHQPASEVFDMLDKLLLLSRGRPVYYGPVDKLVEHFSHSGFPCPPYTNPADFVMNVINSDFETAERSKEQAEKDVEGLVAGYAAHETAATVRRRIAASVDEAGSGGEAEAARLEAEAGAYSVGFTKQFVELSKRNLLDMARNPGIVIVRLVMYGLLAVMVGSLYWDLGNGQLDVPDRLALLFFVSAFEVFMSISALPFFMQERVVFARERANGWYSPHAYVLAQAVTNIPAVFSIALSSAVLIVFMTGLNTSGSGFAVFLLDLFLVLYAAESFILVIAAAVPHYIIGMALAAGAYGGFMLLQGFLRLPSQLPAYWSWLSPLTMHFWAWRVFLHNEFDGLELECDQPVGVDSDGNPVCAWGSGDDVLRVYEADDVSVAGELAGLFIMAVLYRVIFLGILHRYHTGKR